MKGTSISLCEEFCAIHYNTPFIQMRRQSCSKTTKQPASHRCTTEIKCSCASPGIVYMQQASLGNRGQLISYSCAEQIVEPSEITILRACCVEHLFFMIALSKIKLPAEPEPINPQCSMMCCFTAIPCKQSLHELCLCSEAQLLVIPVVYHHPAQY